MAGLEGRYFVLLRAMGIHTRAPAAGPDRGVDIFASPDGLGLQEPRVFVEIKHRPRETIEAPAIRSFLGGRHWRPLPVRRDRQVREGRPV